MDGLERRAVMRRSRELRARLNVWDVLGVYATPSEVDEGDDGEYDDLIGPIVMSLQQAPSAHDLSARIVEILRRDYGLTIPDDDAEVPFARSLIAWWNSAAG